MWQACGPFRDILRQTSYNQNRSVHQLNGIPMRILLALLFVAPLIPMVAISFGQTAVTPLLAGVALVAMAALIWSEGRDNA